MNAHPRIYGPDFDIEIALRNAWFSGFYEGEGSIWNDRSDHNKVTMSLTQKDLTPLIIAKDIWGGAIRKVKYKDKKDVPRVCHDWRIGHEKSMKFIEDIKPYMKIPYKINQLEESLRLFEDAPSLTADYKCHYCEESFYTRSQRGHHTDKHHREKSVCDICTRKFVYPSEVIRHKAINHPEGATYNLTQEELADFENYVAETGNKYLSGIVSTDHVIKGVFSYKCDVEGCRMTAAAKGYITRHKREVHGIVPVRAAKPKFTDGLLVCGIGGCVLQYRRQSELTRHIKQSHPQHIKPKEGKVEPMPKDTTHNHIKRSETMAEQREELRKTMVWKVCTKCKIDKTVAEFGNKSDTKDGKQPYCKKCVNEAKKKSNERMKEKLLAANPHMAPK